VKRSSSGHQVILSRTHPGFLIRLFELEVPEIYEGIVEIKEAVRDSSGRAKIAVMSHDKDVDPVGACVGIKGMRVQSVVQELRGEKIDIIQWMEDQEQFVRNALSPAKVTRVHMNELEKTIQVIVPDDQLSLAIGKRGQNVRLAAKLTHWKIDIKSESEADSHGDRWDALRQAELAFQIPPRTSEGIFPRKDVSTTGDEPVTEAQASATASHTDSPVEHCGSEKAELVITDGSETEPDPMPQTTEDMRAETDDASCTPSGSIDYEKQPAK
jgi:N utilization substance protein A